jgi:hypothetical protein
MELALAAASLKRNNKINNKNKIIIIMKKTVIILSVLTFFVGCYGQTTKKQVEIKCPPIENENTILFSTKDVGGFTASKDIMPPVNIIGGYKMEGDDYNIQKLFDYKNHTVVIVGDWAYFDWEIYMIAVVVNGNIDLDKNLDVTPFWGEPENSEQFYTKKIFKIYADYTIEIITEEKNKGNVQVHTQYYRINENGDFYEVDKQEQYTTTK